MSSYSQAEREANVPTMSLGVTYAISLGSSLTFFVTLVTDLEGQLTSVVRVAELAEDTPQEQACVAVTEVLPPSDWPQHGKIEYVDVQLRYRPDLPLALRGVSFTIHAGERIGVCGRSGSGKSTIMQALFRLVELSGGSVVVDGIPTAAVDVGVLRSRLTIIPQDPMLFKGTVRTNLDPFGQIADERLQRALDRVGMGARLALGSAVAENGDNFSVGQRQLLCLARAMVRDSRILLLDEATANVDAASEAIMQSVVLTDFAGCTVIAIAHRLSTIMGCDRILVLGDGSVLEFASPQSLMADPLSEFHIMVQTQNAAH
jgi:ABC-type multidrug transport system fused ATPase/permease subunit